MARGMHDERPCCPAALVIGDRRVHDRPMRTIAALSTLATAAVLGLAAGGAPAATLYTSAAHTTTVATGATFSASLTAPGLRLTSGTATVDSCSSSTLNFSLTANTGGNVVGTASSGTFGGCNIAQTFAGSWTLEVSGTATHVAGGFRQWNASLTHVHYVFGGGTYTGNLATSGTVAMTQGTTTGTNLCLTLNAAGTISGPLTTVGKWDGTYCLTGTAANWSLN